MTNVHTGIVMCIILNIYNHKTICLFCKFTYNISFKWQ